MQNIELRKNGGFELRMCPSDAVDAAMLDAMATAAGNNQAAIRMVYAEGVAIISVEVRS